MNSQNLLKFWGSRLGLSLDSSEFHDYEIDKTQDDYNSDVIDFDNTIPYSSITVSSTSLLNSDCTRTTIKLVEYNNTPNDSSYVYLGLVWVLDYSTFVNYMGNEDTILNNDVYSYVLNGNTHYFTILSFNDGLSNPSSLSITGFSTTPTQCVSKLADSTSCCPRDPFITAKPWAYQINHGGGSDNCDYSVSRRTEKGWTLDFVFNRETLDWVDGNAFYYWGVRNENNQSDYADNNLSFSFTSDGRIEWRKIHYSGYCGTSAYTQSFYISSGQTPQLCYFGTLDDFNVTITFDRYRHLTDCNIENDGGWNDMIPGLKTSTYSDSEITAVTSTQLSVYTEVEELTKQWARERERRLGVLKIYLNGRPIYKVENWEEVVPSTRGDQPFIQLWGGGSKTANGFHDLGTSCFNMKRIKYFEEPLDFVHVKHHYRVDTKPYYDIIECNEPCEDNVSGVGFIPQNDIEYLLIPDNDIEYLLIPENDLTYELIE